MKIACQLKRIKFFIKQMGLLLAIICFSVIPVQVSEACNYARLTQDYENAKTNYINNPTPQNAVRLCLILRKMKCKFENRPTKPIPPSPLPPGVNCAAVLGDIGLEPKGGGGGRGGTGGGIGLPGSTLPYIIWLRNHHESSCQFSWEITPRPNNPPGFTILGPTSGTVPTPGFSVSPPTIVNFEITIDPLVVPGDSAVYHIDYMDGCTSLSFGEELDSFIVKAIADVRVEPVTPLISVNNQDSIVAKWRIYNDTSNPVTKSYTFRDIPDPASQATLNDGTIYSITNIVPANKANTGGTVTIPPNSFVEIEKIMLPTAYCDPEMIGCCALEIDGAFCCVVMPSDHNVVDGDCGVPYLLEGEATGGGYLLTLRLPRLLFLFILRHSRDKAYQKY